MNPDRSSHSRLIRFKRLTVCAACLLGAAGAAAAVEPAGCFSPRMVLQQAMPLPVWGTAEPGEVVTVEFGGTTATATTDTTGRWQATLSPQEASREPRPLTIRGQNTVTLEEVLVGEVWLCAGQSNMLFPLAKSADAKREVALASEPLLRLFSWQAAATGNRGAYSRAEVAALEPGRFGSGRWQTCTSESAASFSAVGYGFGRKLVRTLDIPVGIIAVAVGGTPAEAWVSRGALAADDRTRPLVTGDWLTNPLLAGWCADRASDNLARARRAGEPIPGDNLGLNHPFKPGFMWEAGIAPLVPLAIRGVAWYQGESNADTPERVAEHEAIFPVLVSDWRQRFGRDDLPVGVVQLPGMERADWPAFRDSQRRLVAATPSAGLVITIDLGDAKDVHPPDKLPVGERLAAWALADVYGRAGPATGPLPQAASREADGSVRIEFTATGGELVTTDGKAPRHFEVAGEGGGFEPATAEIAGDAVNLRCAGELPLGGITMIRYAWRPFPTPVVNLSGKTGLPTTPFGIAVDR